MKAFNQIASMGFLALGILTAHAAPVPPQPVPPPPSEPAASPAPYRLSLSSFDGSSSLPRINVTITNLSPYTLGFGLETAAFTRFTVEYRSDMTPLSRWTMLKPNLQQPLDVSASGKPARASTYSIIILILPKQQYEADDVLVGFPAPEGFYRITAVRAPEMDELSGSANSLKLVRKFDADVRSNPVVIRRTFNGFMEISP